jgi:hypothetical protein
MGEAYAHAAEDELLESGEEEFFSEEENKDVPEEHEEQEYSSNNEVGLSLNDWACAVRLLERSTRCKDDYMSIEESHTLETKPGYRIGP